MIESVTVLGTRHDFGTVAEAVAFLDRVDQEARAVEFQKYEILVRYSNGNRLDGSFSEKSEAKRFLASVAGVPQTG